MAYLVKKIYTYSTNKHIEIISCVCVIRGTIVNTYIKQFVKIGLIFALLLLPFNTVSAEEIAGVATSHGGANFWVVHSLVGGIIFCLMLAIFPRLTLAFMALTGGIGITIVGLILWLLAPHLLVAVIATTLYWHTNPILVILAWFIAFGGEATEKVYLRRRF